jgi:hypothetical protein
MITVSKNIYVPYETIPESIKPLEFPDIVIYPELFGGKIGNDIYSIIKGVYGTTRYYNKIPFQYLKSLNIGIKELTNIDFNSCVLNGPPIFSTTNVQVTLFFQKHRLHFIRKSDNKIVVINTKKGTLIVFRKPFFKYWNYILPKHLVITFFNSNIMQLKDLYLDPLSRENFSEVIQDKLKNVRIQPIGQQCISKYVKFGKLLGKGDYGNVYLASFGELEFAVKLSKLKDGAIDNPYSRYNISWFEVLIMHDILRSLVNLNICPNVPLLIDSFVCNDCVLTIKNDTKNQPCVITITELANGSLRDFLKNEKPTEEDLYSALFQIMAAIHAIQTRGQIMNYDVKADNVLFYNVTPGGYWKYKIHNKNFYIPNTGRLFILNDFGISRPLSPDFQLYRSPLNITFRLGSRYAIVKDGKFSHFNTYKELDTKGDLTNTKTIKWSDKTTSKGGEYRLIKNTQEIINIDTQLTKDQITYLKKIDNSFNPKDKDFFINAEIIPPFEFYNDLQDCIRMFIGGKRTTQKGNHKRYDTVPDSLYNKLQKYNGIGESLKDNIFSTDPSQVLAGYFIESFFTQEHNYTQRIYGKLLGQYEIK